MSGIPPSKAARVGKAVLDGAAKGRAIWQARQAEERAMKQRLILAEYLRLKLAGQPDRGIAGFVARAIQRHGITLSQRQTKRILDTFSGVSKSLCYGLSQNSLTFAGGSPHVHTRPTRS